jgi:hypothetical protein
LVSPLGGDPTSGFLKWMKSIPINTTNATNPSGMSHADDRLTALKGTGFSPYIKPAKSRGL